MRTLRATLGSAGLVAVLAVGLGLASGSSGQDPDSSSVSTEMMQKGRKVFDQNCAACHQQNGQGMDDQFPPLAGNRHLKDPALVIRTIHSGRTGKIEVAGKTFNGTMPPIGASFSDKKVAAVATYVRNGWDNAFGEVTAAQVKKVLSDPKPPEKAKLMSLGESLYQSSCAACHGTEGQGLRGGVFPPLAGDTNLSSNRLIVNALHEGLSGEITVKGVTYDQTMPPAGKRFTPEQTAAVATFVRNSWDNDFGVTSPSTVREILEMNATPHRGS
jgi:mono/diheme cytochrome c family protein